MYLTDLSVLNLGVFRGRHDFFLASEGTSSSSKRHVVVFQGQNGSGKSTLFQALSLALHGSRVLGDRVTQNAYSDFLMSRLHRYDDSGSPMTTNEAEVCVGFQFLQSGTPIEIRVQRAWKRRSDTVRESVGVLLDGDRLDLSSAEAQAWIDDIVPPGLATLCFFDAERLDSFADPGRHDALLYETIHRSLGLDLVQRLQSDLKSFILKQGTHQAQRQRDEILQRQSELGEIEVELGRTQEEMEGLATEQAELESELAQLESRLLAEGGAYAARRSMRQERLATVEAELQALTHEVRELCSGLLPFALAPELCRSLRMTLAREADLFRRRVAHDYLLERAHAIEIAVQEDDFWKDLNVGTKNRQEVSNRLLGLLSESAEMTEDDSCSGTLHQLSETDRETLQGWITQSLDTIPREAERRGKRLQELASERDEIKSDLQRAPDEELLAPIHAEISRVESELSCIRDDSRRLSERIGALEFRRDEKARQIDGLAKDIQAAQVGRKKVELAQLSTLALRSYKDTMIRQKLGRLEEVLVESFNAICHKTGLMKTIEINLDGGHVRFVRRDGHDLQLGELSAGESQLYALSLLLAMRKVSGRELPLIVDTPLARLDEEHRLQVVRDYIPRVSRQVLLFTTDTELDAQMMEEVSPWLARSYTLVSSQELGETSVVASESQKESQQQQNATLNVAREAVGGL